MRITLKFTTQAARRALYALQQEHGLSYNPDLTEDKLEKLIKLNILSVVARQAQIDLESMEKLMPKILEQED
jgi:hypothetical protein